MYAGFKVYNEDLKDLFSPDVEKLPMGRLKIVEDPKTGPWVRNAVQAVATSAEHVMSLIQVNTAVIIRWGGGGKLSSGLEGFGCLVHGLCAFCYSSVSPSVRTVPRT